MQTSFCVQLDGGNMLCPLPALQVTRAYTLAADRSDHRWVQPGILNLTSYRSTEIALSRLKWQSLVFADWKNNAVILIGNISRSQRECNRVVILNLVRVKAHSSLGRRNIKCITLASGTIRAFSAISQEGAWGFITLPRLLFWPLELISLQFCIPPSELHPTQPDWAYQPFISPPHDFPKLRD